MSETKPAGHTHLRIFLITALALGVFSSKGISAEADFYSLGDKWEKTNAVSVAGKKSALEQSFSSALEQSGASIARSGISIPPSLTKNLSELARENKTIEIQLNQSLFVSSSGSIIKFVATDEGIVSFETVGSGNLRIEGTGIGRTFVHIWDGSGRNTFEIQVTPPVVSISAEQLKRIEAFEKTRSFKFGYENSRGAFYSGSKFRDKSRTSLDFNQNFTLTGDTPYGSVQSNVLTQKALGKTVLSDAQFHLNDANIGPFKDFNLGLGDNQVNPQLMVFPNARVRGYEINHTDPDGRVALQSFYGREQSSSVGVLSPGVVTKRTRNSYLSGNLMEFRANEDAQLKVGAFTGSGGSRTDELNEKGLGFQGQVRLGPHVRLIPEVDFDNERFAQKHKAITTFDKVTVKTEARDIDSRFQTMIGNPSQQGEKGYLIDMTADPFENTSFSGSFDIFRDRLVPNPNDADAYNTHTDLMLRVTPTDHSNILLNFQDLDDTGRLGPTKLRTFGGQYNQQIDIFTHKSTIFTRYQNRFSRNINDPSIDYGLDQFTLGVHTEIFWGISFSLSKEWNRLDEFNLPSNGLSYPSVLTYAFDYSHQIGNTPFYMDAHLRFRDEEDTESRNSFMTGEDSAELSGGVYYRQYDNMEIFLTGRFENFVPESRSITEPRIEAEFLTGMRYIFDTQYRWSTVGSFEGFVYKDLNGDGIRQPDEAGIEGMTIKSNDGREAVTDKQGFYELKSVSGKNAVIVLDSAKIPYGFAPTSDVRQEFPIIQDETQQVDYGLTPRSEVTGIIYNDLNGNGKYDSTDAGVRKVRVKLEDGTAARSNNLGVYSFPGAVAGSHTASLDLTTLPEGYLPLDVPNKTFTVFEGIRYELNFPLRATRQVTGRVFLDENANGLMEAAEQPLADVRVLLGTKQMQTDKDGWYLFDDLNSGDFTLKVDENSLSEDQEAPAGYSIHLSDEPTTVSDKNIPITPAR